MILVNKNPALQYILYLWSGWFISSCFPTQEKDVEAGIEGNIQNSVQIYW